LWRPFPARHLVEVLKEARVIAVLDRTLPPGARGGPLAGEIRSAFYPRVDPPVVLNFVAGLGGREINRATFKEMVNRSSKTDFQPENYELLDVRMS